MEEDWKEIFITAHEYQAAMAKDILEDEGIKSVVMNQHDSAYKSFGIYLVYVNEADEKIALELLKSLKH